MTVRDGLKGIGALAILSVATLGLDRLERSTLLGLTGEPVAGDPALAPSSLAVDLSSLDPEVASISIVVDDAALNHPVTGLLTNPSGRGRAWERPAAVSFFDVDRRLVWATKAGLRRHGGASRTRSTRSSWRLHFRDVYRSDAGREPSLRELGVAPQTLVIRRETGRQPNTVSLAVAQRNGAIVPAFRPVRLYINGVKQGDYLLSEHVNRSGWGRSRFGHRDVVMFVYRGGRSTDERSKREYEALASWVDLAPAPLTMDAVSSRVDLDNLLRHLFTFMFCGTTDWAQGAAVRVGADAESRWFWVHWDLDHSFRWSGRNDVEGPALGLIANSGRPSERGDVRARLFSRLRDEDPEFANHFTALVADLLNHRVGSAFIDDVINRFGSVLRRRSRIGLRDYFARRPEVIRTELDEHLGAGPSYPVSISAPTSATLDVDGYAEPSGYSGWYFSGTPVSVDLSNGVGRFSHWIVNGRRHDQRPLVVSVSEETSIRAVLR